MKAWLEDICFESKSTVSPQFEELPKLLQEDEESQDGDNACEVCGLEEDEMSDEEEFQNGTEANRLRVKEEAGGIVKRLLDPRLPSKEEVKEHELSGHLPYRNWCPSCVKAKGKDLDHRKDAGESRGLAEYSFDYCFPGDEFGFKLTVLSGKERVTGMHFASAVPTKGASGKFAVDKALQFMEEVGDTTSKVIVKTDQEPSIQYFVKDLIESRPQGQTVIEESPVKSSGSNGIVERSSSA